MSKRSIGRDIFSVGLSKFLIIIFGLGTSIISARVLGPEKSGMISALLIYPGLFTAIGSLGIRQSTTFFLGKGIYDEETIKTAITQIWFLSTLFSVLVSFVLITQFSSTGDDYVMVGLALATIPFSLFNTYNSGIFLGKNDISAFTTISWIPAGIMCLGMFLFVYVFGYGVRGYMYAAIMGPVYVSGVLLFKNRFIDTFSSRVNLEVVKRMLRLGLVYALALFVINLNYRVDIVLIDNLNTSYSTGIYTKGAGIAQYLWQIPALLSTIVFARSAVSKDDRLFSFKVTQLLRLSFLAVGAGVLFMVFFSETLIIGMFGEEFRESALVLKLLLPGVLLLTIYKVMTMDLAGKGKPLVSMKAMLPALVVNIGLNLLWIPEHGANGAALASTVSYSLAALLFLYFYSREVDIPIREIFRYSRADFAPVVKLLQKIR